MEHETTPLGLRRVGFWGDDVDTLAQRCGGRVPLPVLLDDLNRQARRTRAPGREVAEAWRVDLRDQVDLRWWPQGISTSSDADASGLVAGHRLLAFTWYAKKTPWDEAKHGSRVTILNLETGRYRHVLLVRATADGGVEPLTVHAGGLVWHGRHLHIAATGRGFFTADLGDLLHAPAELADDALRYRYLLPVRAQYRTEKDGHEKYFRFSFCSFDRGTSAMLAGEYTNSPDATRRLALFTLDDDGLPTDAPAQMLGSGPRRMQGAALVGRRLYTSVSQGRLLRGSLYRGDLVSDDTTNSGLRLRQARWALPMGCEDLAYDPNHRELWTLSEHPMARWVCAVRPGDFPAVEGT